MLLHQQARQFQLTWVSSMLYHPRERLLLLYGGRQHLYPMDCFLNPSYKLLFSLKNSCGTFSDVFRLCTLAMSRNSRFPLCPLISLPISLTSFLGIWWRQERGLAFLTSVTCPFVPTWRNIRLGIKTSDLLGVDLFLHLSHDAKMWSRSDIIKLCFHPSGCQYTDFRKLRCLGNFTACSASLH